MVRKTIKRSYVRKPTVGILSVPLSPDSKFFKVCGSSYIASGHIDWLKSYKLNIRVIPYYHNNLKTFINKVDGIYLPSGGAFSSTQKEYYYAAKELIKLAIKENKKRCFPIWGACMGMQQMMIVAEGSDNYNNLLEDFNSYENYKTPAFFTDNSHKTDIYNTLSIEDKDKMQKSNGTLQNHMMGLTPDKFIGLKKLNNFYNIVDVAFDRDNKEFVNTIEAKKYPFFGVQWHPERQPEIRSLLKVYIKCLKTNQIKNKKTKKFLKTHKIKCKNFSNNLYNYCDFYYDHDNPIVNKVQCNYIIEHGRNKDGSKFGTIG